MEGGMYRQHKGRPPKKKFLVRGDLPMLADPCSRFYDKNRNSSSSSSAIDRVSKQEKSKKSSHYGCAPLVIIAPISDEDDNSSMAAASAGSSKEWQKFQSTDSNDSSNTIGLIEKDIDLSNGTSVGSLHGDKRVSFSDTSSLQEPGSPESLSTSISATEDVIVSAAEGVAMEHCSKTSQLVVNTAASVLLLMRFSVSDQALDCLSTKAKATLSNANANSTERNKRERKCGREESANDIAATGISTSLERGQSSSPVIVHAVTPTSSKHILEMSKETPLPKPAQPTTSPARGVSMQQSSAGFNSSTQPKRLFPNRLSMPEDPNELNSLHCFVRARLLEVFYLPPQKGKPNGRVGLRCLFCAHLPRKERVGTTMCSFYPKSLQDLYRSVMTWQRIHFRLCKHVPQDTKEAYWKHKESDQTRGKTEYWITSATRLGLEDISDGRNGICFAPPAKNSMSSDENRSH